MLHDMNCLLHLWPFILLKHLLQIEFDRQQHHKIVDYFYESKKAAAAAAAT